MKYNTRYSRKGKKYYSNIKKYKYEQIRIKEFSKELDGGFKYSIDNSD